MILGIATYPDRCGAEVLVAAPKSAWQNWLGYSLGTVLNELRGLTEPLFPPPTPRL